jgi:tripartite-type tricarboxylate transporter receptor subunit TctC
MRLNSRIATLCSTIACGLAFIAAPAQEASAQEFPRRPVTVTIPFTTGTPVDSAMRIIGAEASHSLGQPMVIENRAGANGRLGLMGLKAAPADGHLLALIFDTVLVAQTILDPNFKWEVGRDYAPVILLVDFPLLLVAHPSLGVRDTNSLISYAKANPGKLNIGGTAGASSYFMAERFRQLAGLSMTIVPYKGSTQSIVDNVAGRVQLLFAPSTAEPFIASGKLVSIATTGKQRWNAFPNVPTFAESGFGLVSNAWYGIVAAAGTPPDVIAKINAAINTALKRPEVVKQLTGFGMNTTGASSPGDFTAFIQQEIREWEPVLRSSGIKLE